jgi:hypothetical protein
MFWLLDIWGIFEFVSTFLFFYDWVGFQVLFSRFREYGVGGAFHLMPLMIYKWEGSHFYPLFFNLISL